MILVLTGDGKGKTTSAIGQAVRALGNGKKVAFLQFIKSDKFPSGEDNILKSIKDIYFVKGGKGFVGILGDNLPFEEHKRAAENLFLKAKDVIAKDKFDLIILDEVNVALSLKLLRVADVVSEIKKFKGGEKDIVLTGRGAPSSIIKIADLVTEMKDIKHYFYQKVFAKKGREF